MLAGKLEQEESPSFAVLSSFMVQSSLRCAIPKKSFIKMENRILNALEFDMSYVSPLPFLERYLRILELDQERNPYSR